MTRWLAMAVALVLAAPAQAAEAPARIPNQPGHWAPREECARLPGFAAFRTRLATAVTRHDAAAFAALASPKIVNGFGGESGRPELLRKLSGSEGEALWRDLGEILHLGCARDGNSIVMPWFFKNDLGDLDEHDIYLVVGVNVPVYEVADSKARVLAHLSWQLVDMPGAYQEGASFQQVDVVGMRRRGYVETAKLRSRGGYRLLAERHRGLWQITYLVEGD